MAGNSNSGRRPKPIPIRALEGTNKRPLPEEPETVPWQEAARPTNFTRDAAEFWDWLVSVLRPMGVLTEQDRALMVETCWHYHFAEAAREEILSTGQIYESFTTIDDDGNVVEPDSQKAKKALVHRKENPANKIMSRESGALERCLCRLGLSPTDRARLAKAPARKHESLLTG